MSLKGKIPPEVKIQAVEDYLAIRKGSTEIIKELGIRRSTFQSWVRKYQMEGRSGLYPKKAFYKLSILTEAGGSRRLPGRRRRYRQELCANWFADSGRMKSAGNRDIFKSRL